MTINTIGRWLYHLGLRRSSTPAFRGESDVDDWLAASGYRDADADYDLVAYVFAEYERRTGYPLSVARGRTGSTGPLYAPRVVDLLGRGRPEGYQHRIVAALLDAVAESGDWIDAFQMARREFEGAAP